MQLAFEARLKRLRWNNFDGYEKSEPYRHMIEDVLFSIRDSSTSPSTRSLKASSKRTSARTQNLPKRAAGDRCPRIETFTAGTATPGTTRKRNKEIPRELKLAFYLTDVRSGAFNYIRGSHRKQHPRPVPNAELKDLSSSEIAEMMGPAGTAFMFDTSGIHRQGVPMLERRHADLLNYHDPDGEIEGR